MIVRAGLAARSRKFASGLVYTCSLPRAERSVWAWLADTHISGGPVAERAGRQPDTELQRVSREVSAVRPDGLVVNGDIAWKDGAAEDYRRFRDILSPALRGAPLVLGVGNHDRRANMLDAFDPELIAEPEWIAACVDLPPYCLIAVDSQLDPSVVGGEVGDSQMAWLEGALASSGARRAILFVHHPGDSLSEGCRDFERLAALAGGSGIVEAIVTGHDHAFSLDRLEGMHLVGLPSSAFPFDSRQDCGWVEARLAADGLALRFHGSRESAELRLRWRGPPG